VDDEHGFVQYVTNGFKTVKPPFAISGDSLAARESPEIAKGGLTVLKPFVTYWTKPCSSSSRHRTTAASVADDTSSAVSQMALSSDSCDVCLPCNRPAAARSAWLWRMWRLYSRRSSKR